MACAARGLWGSHVKRSGFWLQDVKYTQMSTFRTLRTKIHVPCQLNQPKSWLKQTRRVETFRYPRVTQLYSVYKFYPSLERLMLLSGASAERAVDIVRADSSWWASM